MSLASAPALTEHLSLRENSMNEDAASYAYERNGIVLSGTPSPDEIRRIADGLFLRHAANSLSPSIGNGREEPAFEIKFQLDPDQARQVALWAERYLHLDPHARPDLGNAYHVHGLYFDTQALDVFQRSPGYKRRKYRLRRYGESASIFLEQKRKSAGQVAKRRIQVDEAELARLCETQLDEAWTGHWFHRRLNRRRLQPTCLISYQRQAYFGASVEGPLRLTLDRDLRTQQAERWTVAPVKDGLPILPDHVLLELKFRRHLPGAFKGMMQDHGLSPEPISKYRLAMETLNRAVGALRG
jgi:VTC domain